MGGVYIAEAFCFFKNILKKEEYIYILHQEEALFCFCIYLVILEDKSNKEN